MVKYSIKSLISQKSILIPYNLYLIWGFLYILSYSISFFNAYADDAFLSLILFMTEISFIWYVIFKDNIQLKDIVLKYLLFAILGVIFFYLSLLFFFDNYSIYAVIILMLFNSKLNYQIGSSIKKTFLCFYGIIGFTTSFGLLIVLLFFDVSFVEDLIHYISMLVLGFGSISIGFYYLMVQNKNNNISNL